MKRENFTAYEVMPEDLYVYLSHNGPHFNRKAYEFAVSEMYSVDVSGQDVPVSPIEKNEVDALFTTYAIKVKNNKLYDAAYLYSMAKADYPKSLRTADAIAKWIQETLDDPDGADGLVFNRWIADMKWLGIPIPWEEFI